MGGEEEEEGQEVIALSCPHMDSSRAAHSRRAASFCRSVSEWCCLGVRCCCRFCCWPMLIACRVFHPTYRTHCRTVSVDSQPIMRHTLSHTNQCTQTRTRTYIIHTPLHG